MQQLLYSIITGQYLYTETERKEKHWLSLGKAKVTRRCQNSRNGRLKHTLI